MSNNSEAKNRDQKLSLYDHKLTLITYSCRVNSFEDIERNVPVRIQKPCVVTNNSVNINFSQKVLGTKSLACEMIINLPTITYSCRVSSFEDIERNVPVRIQKPLVVSNNSVNINFSQKVLGTKSLACEMIIHLPLLLFLVGLIVSKILREMYRSGFKNQELYQITP